MNAKGENEYVGYYSDLENGSGRNRKAARILENDGISGDAIETAIKE